jgi:hypothetical protein
VRAFHISNRYLDLEPVMGYLARDAGLTCRVRDGASEPGYRLRARWVAMARVPDDLGTLATRWTPCRTDTSRIWTDDYSNLLAVLEF